MRELTPRTPYGALMDRRLAALAAAAALSLTLSSCGQDTEDASEDSSADQSSAGDGTASPTPSRSTPAPATTTAPASTAPSATGLPGIGMTRPEWDNTHAAAPGYAEGAVYGPVVRDGQPQYATVSGDDYISIYSRYFPEVTDLSTAKSLITQEKLPADAQLAEEQQDPECARAQYTSEQLNAARGEPLTISVAYFSEEELLSPNDVVFSNVVLLPPDSKLSGFTC